MHNCARCSKLRRIARDCPRQHKIAQDCSRASKISHIRFKFYKVVQNSPNSCLQHGVLAMNLINWLVYARFASRVQPQLLSHVCSDFNILESTLFRMLLESPGKSTSCTASCLSLITGVSKSCCSPSHAQNEKPRHLSSTLVIIKHVQTR